MADELERCPLPMLAGNWSREEWEAAHEAVFAQRVQYPPDSLSAIYRDIAITLQAKLEEKESYICNFEHATKIERADNEAELQRLRTENARLKQPVTDEEWEIMEYWIRQPHGIPARKELNAVLASRASTPASTEDKS